MIAAVVNYQSGNIGGLLHSINSLGVRAEAHENIRSARQLDVIILPGVGTASLAGHWLHAGGWADFMKQWSDLGKPILGICLGLQLLGDHSREGTGATGLSLIHGETVPRETPRIGWVATTEEPTESQLQTSSLRRPNTYFFCHSHEFVPAKAYEIGWTLDAKPSVAVIRSGSITGVQFHPEKSQQSGRRWLDSYFRGLQTVS